MVVLPDFNANGDLPVGVHRAGWDEFRSRFGSRSLRRDWLLTRFEALVALAAGTSKLHRVFVWGSFVTQKASPKDIDLLLIMDADFQVESVTAAAQTVFNSVRAKLMFAPDVFWARAAIGEDVLAIWLETYQVSRNSQKRGIVELVLQ